MPLSYRTNEVNLARLARLAADTGTTPNALISEGLKLLFAQHGIPWSEMPSGRPAAIKLSAYARELFDAPAPMVTSTEIMIAWPEVTEISKRDTSRWWAHFDGTPSGEKLQRGAIADEDETGYWLPISD